MHAVPRSVLTLALAVTVFSLPAWSATGDDISPWTYPAGLNTLLLYASTLLAVGTALFALTLGLAGGDAACRSSRVGQIAATVAALSFVAAVGIGGANMMDESAGALLSVHTWTMAAHTTLGSSAALGVAGMVLLGIGFYAGGGGRKMLLAIGALLGICSFLVTGHAATAPPRWFMAPVIAVHLAAAAFWLGALFPLLNATLGGHAAEAGAVMKRFSHLAIIAVGALIASGVVTTIVQVRTIDGLLSTSYGNRLLIKLGAFGALLLIAAYNKFSLTPRLEQGVAASAAQMRRSIAVEYLLFVVILAAAASLTLVGPPRE